MNTNRSPFVLGLAALALTTLGMAMGSIPGAATPQAGTPQAGTPDRTAREPFACAFTAREAGGGVSIEARLDAREAIAGSYALRIRASGGGTAIDQSGDFSAGPGESLVLGEATLSGRAADLDATLTLTTGGRTVACPLETI